MSYFYIPWYLNFIGTFISANAELIEQMLYILLLSKYHIVEGIEVDHIFTNIFLL